MSETTLIQCSACGATNRVPRHKLDRGLAPVCGKCKTPLPAGGRPVTVTDATFTAEVERSPLPVLLDLWAPWCGPCRMIAPVVDEQAAEMSARVRFAKLNIDENPATAARLDVRGIPTLLVLRDGREVDRIAVPEAGRRASRPPAVGHPGRDQHDHGQAARQPLGTQGENRAGAGPQRRAGRPADHRRGRSKVVLKGTVRSWAEKEEAERAA